MTGASLLPYLRLVRAPAVFSALGDPLAGMLISRGTAEAGPAARLSGAAAALYLAGMALNDLADRAEDARERPERPIPSGAVSAAEATGIGTGLLLAGVLTARGAGAGRTAAQLAATITAYNFVLKHSAAVGPLAMGACRALSLRMGAAAAHPGRGGGAAGTESALLGAYVAGLTWLARGETGGRSAAAVRGGAAVAATALAAAAWRGRGRATPWVLAVSALAGPAVLRAVREPVPARVGPAVGAMVRAIPALDAALVAPRAPLGALAFVPLLALARWGRKLIPVH